MNKMSRPICSQLNTGIILEPINKNSSKISIKCSSGSYAIHKQTYHQLHAKWWELLWWVYSIVLQYIVTPHQMPWQYPYNNAQYFTTQTYHLSTWYTGNSRWAAERVNNLNPHCIKLMITWPWHNITIPVCPWHLWHIATPTCENPSSEMSGKMISVKQHCIICVCSIRVF